MRHKICLTLIVSCADVFTYKAHTVISGINLFKLCSLCVASFHLIELYLVKGICTNSYAHSVNKDING